MDAIILAAGRGTRMRALTDDTPKPLLQAANRPLITYQIDALVAAGAQRIVINTAYLGDQFQQTLGTGDQFGVELVYSPEPEDALETAGGIGLMLNRELIRSDPFIVTNGDVYSTFDYQRLSLDQQTDVQLVVVDNPDFHPDGDFVFHESRLIDDTQAARQGLSRRLTFSGIGLYRQALFSTLKRETQRLKLAPLLRQAMADERASAIHHQGFWISVDTPDRLQTLSTHLLG